MPPPRETNTAPKTGYENAPRHGRRQESRALPSSLGRLSNGAGAAETLGVVAHSEGCDKCFLGMLTLPYSRIFALPMSASVSPPD
jgi:hypothetical protein